VLAVVDHIIVMIEMILILLPLLFFSQVRPFSLPSWCSTEVWRI
jgi:hypothetical protein